MKEIVAIIRSQKWQETKTKLMEAGFDTYTVQRVNGRGQQKGLRYRTSTGKEVQGIQYLPKRMVTLFIKDEDVPKVTDIFIKANRTGEIGDGKIFVCPLEGPFI